MKKTTTTPTRRQTNDDRITEKKDHKERKEERRNEQTHECECEACIAFDIKLHFRMSKNCVWHLSNYIFFSAVTRNLFNDFTTERRPSDRLSQ